MARRNNKITWGTGFNITETSPIDSRMVVDTVDDLYNTSTWNSTYVGIYKGMTVTISKTGEIYVLLDPNKYNELSSWKKVSATESVSISYATNTTYGTVKGSNDISINNGIITVLNSNKLNNKLSSDYQLVSNSVGKKTIEDGEIFNDYMNNKAVSNSHAEGNNTKAIGEKSHAEGSGDYIITGNNFSLGSSQYRNGNLLVMDYDLTSEWSSKIGKSFKIEYNNPIKTLLPDIYILKSVTYENEGTIFDFNKNIPEEIDYSFGVNLYLLELRANVAKGYASHVEGICTYANEKASHAEGLGTITHNVGEHAEGYYNKSNNGKTISSIGIGENDKRRKNAIEILNTGDIYVYNIGNYKGTSVIQPLSLQKVVNNKLPIKDAVGKKTIYDGEIFNNYTYNQATGKNSHAEGYKTIAKGNSSHAEGGAASVRNPDTGDWEDSKQYTVASGGVSHAEGASTQAAGAAAHAEGMNTYSGGEATHAEGMNTYALSNYAHAEGSHTSAYGQSSHAEGDHTIANAMFSHTEGYYTYADAHNAHAEGYNTYALGMSTHTEGNETYAYGFSAHAEGWNTIATGDYSHTEGHNCITTTNHPAIKNIIITKDNNENKELNWNNSYTYWHTSNNEIIVKPNCFSMLHHMEGDVIIKNSYQQKNSQQLYNNSENIDITSKSDININPMPDIKPTPIIKPNINNIKVTQTEYPNNFLYKYKYYAVTDTNNEKWNIIDINTTNILGGGAHAEGLSTITYNGAEHAEGKYNISNIVENKPELSVQSSIGIGNETNRKNAQEVMQNGDFYVYGIGNYKGQLLDTVDNNTGKGTGNKLLNVKSLQEVINTLYKKYDVSYLCNKINQSTTNINLTYEDLKIVFGKPFDIPHTYNIPFVITKSNFPLEGKFIFIKYDFENINTNKCKGGEIWWQFGYWEYNLKIADGITPTGTLIAIDNSGKSPKFGEEYKKIFN